MKMARSEFHLNIADVIISLTVPRISRASFLSYSYPDFVRDTTRARPDITLVTHYGKPPLDRQSGSIIIKEPKRLMVLKNDYASGNIYVEPDSAIIFRRYPLQHPFDKMLLFNYLSQRREGSIIHACGIDDQGRGLLFAGVSGSGKSTMAKLWGEKTVLNDDRIIVRSKEGRFWLYGTPWHGDVRQCSGQRVPLEKIFFLSHGRKNILKKIKPLKAACCLLKNSLYPLWPGTDLVPQVDFYAALTREIPCYELNFTPDKSIVDFIKAKT